MRRRRGRRRDPRVRGDAHAFAVTTSLTVDYATSDGTATAEAAGGSLGFWSRSASSDFAGREDALALGGDVRTTMFGADYSRGRMITSVSLSHSRGLGTYAGDGADGQVASAVTGLYPWIGFKPSERVTVWTVAGYGTGGLRLDPGGGAPIETGLSMAMVAGSGRGEIVAHGGRAEPRSSTG